MTSVTSNIIPASNSTYDLGTSSLRWRDLYLSGNTIDLGGTAIKSSANGISFTNAANPEATVPLTVSSVQIASGGNTVTLVAGASGLQTLDPSGNYSSGSGGGGGLTWQSVQTDNFTASAGNAYPVNTTSAAITVTLPASPSAGQQVQLLDYAGTWATNIVTIARNGNNINGLASNFYLTTNRGAATLTYVDATQGWVGSDAFAVTSLGAIPVDYLVVAGGGGGGGNNNAGGGGAGGYKTGSLNPLVGSSITVTVGAGGSGSSSTAQGSDGSNSVLSSVTSTGGGGGGSGNGTSAGRNGGSGGGAAYDNTTTGGTGTSGQGFNGGVGQGLVAPYYGGGGGGAGEAGNTDAQGEGGDGVSSSITGSSVFYAGGGGAGANIPGGTARSGGAGGGGTGGLSSTSNATSGSTNLGGGGGGSSSSPSVTGGSGGSGVVIIAYPDTYPALASIGAGLTYNQPTRSGYRVYRFTAGTGTISW